MFKMKRAIGLSVFLIVLCAAGISATVCAEPINTTVTAAEGWEQATYDTATNLLENLSQGYAFKIIRNDSKKTAILEANRTQTAETIVIPAAFTYSGEEYKITEMKAYILGSGNESVKNVVISNGVTNVGSPSSGSNSAQVFRNALALESIELPNSIIALSSNCFMGSTKLSSINIPEGVTTIPSQAFSGCTSLENVIFNGNNLTTILSNAFTKCSALTGFTNFPNSVTTIEKSAFSETGITAFEFPAGVTTIPDTVFSSAKQLDEVVFKGNVTTFGNEIFKYCTMSKIDFQGSVAPTVFGSLGQYSGAGVTVYYPADSTGYDAPEFRALFSKATFVQMGRYNTVYINISPGASPTELNASWFGVEASEKTYFQIAPNTEQGVFPSAGVMEFESTKTTTGSGFESSKATATGLAPNTEYLYRVGDGTTWGEVYTYRTGDFSSFDFIFVTDSHIGVKAPEVDAIAWGDTLDKARAKYPNAGLLISSGDQTDKGFDQQFAKFFEPAALRGMMIVAVGGSNHDDVARFKDYFNFPNLSPDKGITVSGSDYYFTYGDALFMVLNTSNSSSSTHNSFMTETIAANPGYKWKFAMFHHSIFSAGDRYPLSGSSYVNDLRKNMSPTITSLGIDAVFMGHDHGYARTYILNGINAALDQTVDADGRILNPTGVQYITGNSSTGNKFYELAEPLPDWVKVASKNLVTFSGISIKGNTLTITTYRTDTMDVLDQVTLCKEDALSSADAQITISANGNKLASLSDEIQLTLTPKGGVDLAGAEIVFETTESGILSIDQNAKVKLAQMPPFDKTFRIWAKATVGGQTYVSDAVTVQVKTNLPDFSLLEERFSYEAKNQSGVISIPAGQHLPQDTTSLTINAGLVKNRPMNKGFAVIAGIYNSDNDLVSVAMNLMNSPTEPMDIGRAYPITMELNIPDDVNKEEMYAKVFFWKDITKLMPLRERADIPH